LNLISACQINSQQLTSGENTNMDIGEISIEEFRPATGEQRLRFEN